MASEVEIATPNLRAIARNCCGDACLPLLRRYHDEPDQWWVICGCGANYRAEDHRLYWQQRNRSGTWQPTEPPAVPHLNWVSAH